MLKLWRQRQAGSTDSSILPRPATSPARRCFATSASPALASHASFLRVCAKTKALQKGRQAHHFLIKQGLEENLIISNLLLHLYGACGALDELHCLFNRMHHLDLSSWNFAIKAQALQGHHLDALQLFAHMQHQGLLPNKFILISLFTALTQHANLKSGMCIHACMCRSKIDMDVAVRTALIIMYGNCSELELARREFDNVSQHDAISWTAMIVVYAQQGRAEEALSLFDHMLWEGVMPDTVTFVSALDACAGHEALIKGKQLHFFIMSSGLEVNVVIGTALVNMYGKCGCLLDACTTFLNMQERNLVSWNALMGSYSHNKKSGDAFQLFEQMLQEGTLPNKVTFVSTFDACSSIISTATGKQTHARIVGNAFEQDIVIQTALIDFYGNCGQFSRACRVFENMSDRDDVSLISIISACANCAAFFEGKQLHGYIICSAFESNVVLGTALINMYSKCGSVQDAQNVFDRVHKRNIISWNAIIGAYCQNGLGKQTLSLYERMVLEKVKPDGVTFLSVLSACSHAGLLKEGCGCFLAMKQDYGIVPNVDHYNCMIDLLGRTGRLIEAEELIVNMPVEPCIASWTTLLSACRKEVDVVRAERAAFRLFDMDPEDTVPHVMLSNTYAAAGRVDDAEMVMTRMREKGLKKKPDQKTTAFDVGDPLHSQKDDIDARVHMLMKSIDDTGSAPKAHVVGLQ
eukprot:c12200_g1_i1 orf=41-2116(+)